MVKTVRNPKTLQNIEEYPNVEELLQIFKIRQVLQAFIQVSYLGMAEFGHHLGLIIVEAFEILGFFFAVTFV